MSSVRFWAYTGMNTHMGGQSTPQSGHQLEPPLVGYQHTLGLAREPFRTGPHVPTEWNTPTTNRSRHARRTPKSDDGLMMLEADLQPRLGPPAEPALPKITSSTNLLTSHLQVT